MAVHPAGAAQEPPSVPTGDWPGPSEMQRGVRGRALRGPSLVSWVSRAPSPAEHTGGVRDTQGAGEPRGARSETAQVGSSGPKAWASGLSQDPKTCSSPGGKPSPLGILKQSGVRISVRIPKAFGRSHVRTGDSTVSPHSISPGASVAFCFESATGEQRRSGGTRRRWWEVPPPLCLSGRGFPRARLPRQPRLPPQRASPARGFCLRYCE